ncbi:MAG: hypothetical protein KF819_26120 [Labilithrix sp.]|nr:hypothetical protein [Labilithrix sp.]
MPTAARSHLVARSITSAMFDAPSPALVWTGDGVRADRWGRLHCARHAMDARARAISASETACASVTKLLVIQILRPQSHADVRDWLVSCRDDDVGPETIAAVVADVQRGLSASEELMVGYDPRRGRARLLWPWGGRTDVYDEPFMRAIWRAYFTTSDQPELGEQLLRWSAHVAARSS